tara:strand:- start:13062 stop:13592 length:531 start_codon:yes stop_codon:yes gene_type:complete
MVIYRVPPTTSDITFEGGVVESLTLKWEKYNKSDLTEVKVTGAISHVQKSEPTFTDGTITDTPVVPTVSHDEETANVETVIGYKGYESATPVDSYTATVDYDAPKFQADDIDLNIFETQTYDISAESQANITSFNESLPSDARDLDISSSSGHWFGAYSGMVAKEENTKEFKEWSI